MNALFTDLKIVSEEKSEGRIISDLGCEGVFFIRSDYYKFSCCIPVLSICNNIYF